MVPQSPPQIIRDTRGLSTNPNPKPLVGRRPEAAKGSKRRLQGPVPDKKAPKETYVPRGDERSPGPNIAPPPSVRRGNGRVLNFSPEGLTPPASLRAPVNIGEHFKKKSREKAIRTWWNSKGKKNPVKGPIYWWWFKTKAPYGQGSAKYYIRPTKANWKGEWREFKPPY